jgi:hypothetical protein
VSLLPIFRLLLTSFELIFILAPSFLHISLQINAQDCSWEALSFWRHLNALHVSSKAVNDGKEEWWHL